jgi:hypothetical protein
MMFWVTATSTSGLSAYERGVRTVFPNSLRGVFVPDGAERSPSQLILAAWRARWWALAPAILLSIVVWVVTVPMLAAEPGMLKVGVGSSLLVLWIWGAQYRKEQRSDRDVFFQQYATARGLQLSSDCQLPARVPLMTAGDERICDHLLHGRMGELEASLANYTYKKLDKKQLGRKKDETCYRYLVLHVKLPNDVARRYRGVFVTSRREMFKPKTPISAREVRFESNLFEGRYEIHVTQTQDDIALYELFSTTLIDALARGPIITWQQMGDDLVFYRRNHCDVTMQLDRFVMDAQLVIRRYLEEWQ